MKRDRAFLDLDLVRQIGRINPLRSAHTAGEVFFQHYVAAGGDPGRLPALCKAKRRAFLASHLAQARANGESWFLPSGMPTARHFAFVMWGWSPAPVRLREFLKHSARVGQPGAIETFYDAQVRAALRNELSNRAITPPKLIVRSYLPGEPWGGKFDPGVWPTVMLFPSDNAAMNRAIVVHELTHWVRHHTGDPKGYHDDRFCKVVDRMFRRAGISREIQSAVERVGGCES